MKILIVLTSHDRLGDTNKKTGLWLEEFVAPYYVFQDAQVDITLASPKGGQPPIDPRSEEAVAQTPMTQRFKGDKRAQAALANTAKLSSVSADEYDAIFYAGGHGPLWDLAEDRNSIALIEAMHRAGKPVGAVCHGTGALRRVKAPDGSPLVKNKSVTGFSNSEEAAIGLTHVVPFLVEDMLTENGGRYSKASNWQPHVVTDGNLITGQNPQSAHAGANAMLDRLSSRAATARAAGAERRA